eukprot:2211482-Amphidinium_carterae.1
MNIVKQLTALTKQVGNKAAGTQQPNKGSGEGTRRGGGRRQSDNSDGWCCKPCEFYGFGYRPVCFKGKEVKSPKMQTPGALAPKPRPALLEEPMMHFVVAKVLPAQQTPLVTGFLAVQQQKREALSTAAADASM